MIGIEGQERDRTLGTKVKPQFLYMNFWWRRIEKRRAGRGRLLLRWVVGEADTLCDVALETFHTGLEESLLVIIEVCEWVVNLLNTTGL